MFVLLRTSRFAALIGLIILASGCSWLRPGISVPKDFRASPRGQALIVPETRMQAYAETFPELAKLQLKGDMVARGRWMLGKQLLDILLFGLDADNLRLRASLLQQPILDLIVKDGFMTVIVYEEGRAYRGQTEDGVSPFGELFGVEPGDLLPIFELGQLVAARSFDVAGRQQTMLTPAEEHGDGLLWIRLDKRTGLPREARWERGGRNWRVHYREWDLFTDQRAPGVERLLPRRLRVDSSDSGARIDFIVQSYQLNESVPENIYRIYTPYALTYRPLAELEEALRGK